MTQILAKSNSKKWGIDVDLLIRSQNPYTTTSLGSSFFGSGVGVTGVGVGFTISGFFTGVVGFVDVGVVVGVVVAGGFALPLITTSGFLGAAQSVVIPQYCESVNSVGDLPSVYSMFAYFLLFVI